MKPAKLHVDLFLAVAWALMLAWPAAAAQGSSAGSDASSGAQAYPTKPIRMVAPFASGSTVDTLARLVGQKLTEAWGRPVVIDNRAGAGGTIGTEIVAKAPADGYTLLLVPNSHAINASLYRTLRYDTLNDFAPVTQLASAPQLLAVHASLPANSLRELIALAAAKPGQIRYGSGGNGSPSHLAVELLKSMAGVDLAHVPYKGGDTTLNALVSGEVHLSSVAIRSGMPHVKGGRLKALAVTGPTRSPAVPDIPAVAESVPGYSMTAWWGILAPAKTPKPIVARLQGEIARNLQLPELRARLAGFGLEAVGSTSQAFDAFIRREIALWAKTVKQSGARVD